MFVIIPRFNRVVHADELRVESAQYLAFVEVDARKGIGAGVRVTRRKGQAPARNNCLAGRGRVGVIRIVFRAVDLSKVRQGDGGHLIG